MTTVPPLPGFSIRPATEEDVPRLMGLTQDLAVYETMTREVVATVAEVRSKSTLQGDWTAWTVPRP